MDCQTVLDRLLVVDLEDLDEAGPLADHIAACASCRARARRVRTATGRLAADLATAARPPAGAVPLRHGPPRRRTALVAGLAAAAALALFTLAPEDRPPLPDSASPTAPTVDVPAGRNAVVFRTSDPSITVVWYY